MRSHSAILDSRLCAVRCDGVPGEAADMDSGEGELSLADKKTLAFGLVGLGLVLKKWF